MTRRQFVEPLGATCANWNWCWSFIIERERRIIFGAWDTNTKGDRAKILSDDWQTNDQDRKNPGYDKSVEHVRLVKEEGYSLETFPMVQRQLPNGKVKIKRIIPILSLKKLFRDGKAWYALDSDQEVIEPLPEELPEPKDLFEGAKTTVTINAYERNPKARAACIAHHGWECAACGFDFVKVYGPIGRKFIHVHHKTPIGRAGKQYRVDPINDLIPVCPNCHAMIHRSPKFVLTIQQLRNYLRSK